MTSLPGAVGRRAVRGALALLALAVVATPFTIAWQRHALSRQVAEQFGTPAAAPDTATAAAWASAGSGLPGRTAPVVLAYHDIRPLAATEDHPDPLRNPGHHYVVTPERFDAQLSALAAAGYTSLTSARYTDYLRGGEVPERSVLITFDDGTGGLWSYADPILERHGMHGVAFLITGNVGAKRPYYLTWQEIERMAGSGRWDLQAHTHKMHARMPIDRDGRTSASEFVHRRWLAEDGRLETLAEFEEKIRADTRRSVQVMVDHGLPRPTLFAYPFSELHGADATAVDAEASATAAAIVEAEFLATFTNNAPRPLPSGARGAADGLIARVEADITTTPEELLDQVRAHTPVIPAQAAPALRGDLWTAADGPDRAPARPLGDRLDLGCAGIWCELSYGRHAAADWASWRASTTVTGLAAPGTESASVAARIGSAEPVHVRLSAGWAQITVGEGDAARVIREAELRVSDRHQVSLDVTPAAVGVVIDGGAVRMTAPSSGGTDSLGGFGVAARRTANPEARWPVFTDLVISEGGEAAGVRAGVAIPTAR